MGAQAFKRQAYQVKMQQVFKGKIMSKSLSLLSACLWWKNTTSFCMILIFTKVETYIQDINIAQVRDRDVFVWESVTYRNGSRFHILGTRITQRDPGVCVSAYLWVPSRFLP